MSQAPTPSAIPVALPTVILCNARTQDFCISEGHFILQRPIQPPANDSVDPTYRYGMTANGTRDPHHGVEFVNEEGTPVHAAAAGRVVFAGSDEQALYSPWTNYYGNLVVLAHKEGLYTLYAHLSAVKVVKGQQVRAGEVIGTVGSTGTAFGSHLHFEVRLGNPEDYFSTQNPELWLAPGNSRRREVGAIQLSFVGPNSEYIRTEFTLAQYADRTRSPAATHYLSTYVSALATGGENAGVGELPAGDYRIAFIYNGQLHERWVEVESGRLTQVVFAIN